MGAMRDFGLVQPHAKMMNCAKRIRDIGRAHPSLAQVHKRIVIWCFDLREHLRILNSRHRVFVGPQSF